MDREAARQAIADIEHTRERALKLRGYANAAPIFAAWGFAWLIMNLARYYGIPFAELWGAGALCVAIIVSVVCGLRNQHSHVGIEKRRRYLIAGASFGASLLGLSLLAASADQLLANAIVSWVIASVYVMGGIWFGSRISVLGIILGGTVLCAWFVARDHFELIMGLAGGGALMLTSLWLWRS